MAAAQVVGGVDRRLSCFGGTQCVGAVSEANVEGLGTNGVHRRTSFGERKLKVLRTEEWLGRDRIRTKGGRRRITPMAMWGQKAEPKPTWVPLELISTEAQFDQVISEAQERKEAVVIEWMAAWCRKCIYLKPKLEKLGAEYHPHIKFYYVDVNNVPQTLVKRAEVTKMPTIQLWKDGIREAEVIGGHQAWQVLDEIKDMISRSKPRV